MFYNVANGSINNCRGRAPARPDGTGVRNEENPDCGR